MTSEDELHWAFAYYRPDVLPGEKWVVTVHLYPADWDVERVLEDFEIWLDVNQPGAMLVSYAKPAPTPDETPVWTTVER